MQAEQPMQKLLAKKLNQDDELALNLLKTAYHVAKRELPKEEMKHMISYAQSLGVNFSKTDLPSLKYTSHSSVTELQSALAHVILEDKMSAVKESSIFGITIDESTDRGNQKRLLMYIQYVTSDGVSYCLLSNKKISEGSANAKNIVKLVLEEVEAKGLEIRNMVGIGTDGASVMTGKTGGVVKLLRDHSPALIGVHCAAHRTALAASQAAKHVPEMEAYQRTIMNIFRYFNNSALRSNRLRAIQALLNMPELKFAEVHSVRWLSMHQAVQIIYRTFPALVMTLEREAILEPAAKGILHEVTQFKFIALTHLMLDILPFMMRLSKKFQADSVNFSVVRPFVQSICDSLRDLAEVEGVFVEKLTEYVREEDNRVVYTRPLSESDCATLTTSINSNYEFLGFSDEEDTDEEEDQVDVGFSPELKYYHQQKDIVKKVTPLYVDNLTKNLEDRFQDTELLECMEVVDPKNIAEVKEVAKYGLEEITKLGTHFESYLPAKEDLKSEYQIYKRLIKGSYINASIDTVLSGLLKSDDLPNMTTLLKCCFVIPMTSVKCERGFSTQNRIKSNFRTSLECKTLDDLMRISEDGPDPDEMDFNRALKYWKKEKVRQLYSA